MKLDGERLAIVPAAPPAAGPERALDPPPPEKGRPELGDEDVDAEVAVNPLLAVVVKMYAPPETAMAAATTARSLVGLRKNIDRFPSTRIAHEAGRHDDRSASPGGFRELRRAVIVPGPDVCAARVVAAANGAPTSITGSQLFRRRYITHRLVV